jgi:hypothetical protein
VKGASAQAKGASKGVFVPTYGVLVYGYFFSFAAHE